MEKKQPTPQLTSSLPLATGQIQILNTFAEERVLYCRLSHITSTSAHLGLIWDIAWGEKMFKKTEKKENTTGQKTTTIKKSFMSRKLSCSSHKHNLEIKVELKVIKGY